MLHLWGDTANEKSRAFRSTVIRHSKRVLTVLNRVFYKKPKEGTYKIINRNMILLT